MAKYELTDADRERLARDFRYHPPSPEQIVRYNDIRHAAHDLATLLMASCPPSRERGLAITKLEEAVFWANAAIARNV